MTSTTTAGDRWRRGVRVWGIPLGTFVLAVSLVVHVVFLGAAWQFDLFGRTLVFDREEEERRTAEVEQREAERRAKEERERAEKQLPEEHARKLKREAETQVTRELARKIETIRKTHEEVVAIRERKLAQVEGRPEDLYRRHLVDRVRERAEELQREAYKLAEATELKPAKQTEQRAWATMTEAKEYLEQLAARLAELGDEAEEEAEEEAKLQETAETLVTITRQAVERAQQAVEAAPAEHRAQAERVAERAERLAAEAEQLASPELDTTAFNDTAAAGDPPQLPPEQLEDLAQKSPAELYDTARQLEAAVHEAAEDARAAELAMRQNTSLAEAQQKLASAGPPARPDLAAQLQAQPTATIADLNAHRQTLGETVTHAESMRMATSTQLAQVAGIDPGASAMTRQAIQSQYAQMLALQHAVAASANAGFADLSQQMALQWNTGGGSGDSAVYMHENIQAGSGRQHEINRNRGIRIDQNEVSAQALPGRKFNRDSPRQGWLYIDTWYIIGPWENEGDLGFTEVHPPEYEINFDAEYAGKVIDGEPKKLRWQFTQADMIRVTPPDERRMSTYYAYTELYFEEDTDMLLALATDDAGKMWINDRLVWQDQGLSAYRIGENFRRVFFRKGYNKLLVRIENDPAYCQFSVLICPPEVAERG